MIFPPDSAGASRGQRSEAEREVFVPLGDPPGEHVFTRGEPSGVKRLRSEHGKWQDARTPSGDKIIFDPDYDLLLASEREARKQLLAPGNASADILKELTDKIRGPVVARELHLQEVRDKELRDVVDTLFGKNGDRDWRIGAVSSRPGATIMPETNLSA